MSATKLHRVHLSWWQKDLISVWIFLRLLCNDDEYSVDKFSDNGHKHWFSVSGCDANFVIMQFNPESVHQPCLFVSIVDAVAGHPLWAHLQCPFYHSSNNGPSIWANTYGIHTTEEKRIEQNCTEYKDKHCTDQCTLITNDLVCSPYVHDILTPYTLLYQPGTFHSKEFNHHSQSTTYVCYTHSFALLLCWAHAWLVHQATWWSWTV